MDVVNWVRSWFASQEPVEVPKEQTEYLRELLVSLESFNASEAVMIRLMPSRFPDIYHLIAAITDARQNIRASVALPAYVKGEAGKPSKSISDYITDHEGRAADRAMCFARLSEETAKLLDALDRVKKTNDIEHRHYLMGLEVLLLEIGLVIETYTGPK